MTEIVQSIPARLKNAAVGGHVAGAADILDDSMNKTQDTINFEVNTAIGTDDTAGSIKGRIKALENEMSSRVTGSDLTADKLVLGNGNSAVKTSSKGITTTAPTSSSTDADVPTSRAVWSSLTEKQDTISDLSTIRSGAAAGATAYQKPSGGIPKPDLSSGVQTSLGKADSALQSHQMVTDNNPTLAWSTKSKVATIGSTEINVTMPANPNTNTAQLQVSDTSNRKINTAESTGKYIQFTGGTNKITVSDGTSSFDVAVTPSINNNVTGSGLTADNIVLGNGNSAVKTSSKSITNTNPSSSSDDNSIPTSKAVWGAISDGIAANDAMIYKGTIAGGSTGSYGALTPAADMGHTYKVTTAGKIDGAEVKTGDLIICNTDSTAEATSSNYAIIAAKWDVIHTSLDGIVIGPSSSTDGRVAVFDGATGCVIKDSGYTIAKSVPSDAKFTDTTYSAATQSAAGLMSAADKTKLDGVAAGATANTGTITGITMNGASKGTSGVVNLGTVITDVSGKADKSATVSNVTYDASTRYLKKTINGTESTIIAASTIVKDGGVTLASGTNNGTLKLTVGGTATDNIAVKGLGGAAYKNVTDEITDSSILLVPYAGAVKDYVDDRIVIPVDVNILTPSSTFVKGNVIGINSIFYYCTQDTTNFPVILASQGDEFVYNEKDGHKCFVVTDATIQTGWEQWCDDFVEYWLSLKQDKLTFDTYPTAGSSNPVTSGGIRNSEHDLLVAITAVTDTLDENKQDKLTFDSLPTDSSTNPVESGGVYTALSSKQDTLQYVSMPTSGSQKMVKSGGIYNSLAAVIWKISYQSWNTKTLTAGECAISTNNYYDTYTVTINDYVVYVHRYAFAVYSEAGFTITLNINMTSQSSTIHKTKTLTHPSGKASGMYYFEVLVQNGKIYLVESYKEWTEIT